MARTTFSGPVKSDNGFEGDFTGDNVTAGTGTIDVLNATIMTVSDGTSTDDLTATGVVTLSGQSVLMTALPTADPLVAGRLWNDSGTLKVSAGA